MSKHDEHLKLKVVTQYLAGGIGFRALAQTHGVGRSVVRRWVAEYKLHGVDGLRRKGHSKYSAQFKREALERMQQENLSRTQMQAILGIRDPGALARWQRQYHEGGFPALLPRPKGRRAKMSTVSPTESTSSDTESDTRTREQLLKENEYLRAEVAYLKKPRCLGSGGATSAATRKAQVVLELRQSHALAILLDVAGLARSTFYYQLKVLQAGDRYAGLKQRIRAIYESHQGRYGYRRITAVVRQAGERINHKLVRRLMVQLGLKSLVRPKKYRSYRGPVGRVAPNVLNRQFEARRPNEKWVTDVTEFNVKGRKLYLSPVMDLYNGEIIAWQSSVQPTFDLVGSMLKKAFSRLGRGERPLLHSDQGWQYQMAAYRRLLDQRAIRQSMSRKGNCLDNAAMESFFGTLKAEFFHLNEFDSVEQLQAGIQQYIHYYNHERIRLKLKGLSPVQYRTQPFLA
ncbi:IS3 family transposase [Burkholderia sola]|uniref:IS3 family transposase n=1 Tax=Burkholderia sola TaxID=2843302 RepID=UPI0023DE12B1|nr:IS3 family transposase [Burkholderia sola]MDF3083358.1 IS3 family transposase [Burkholderia sola]